MDTITIKDYDKIPMLYDDDGGINNINLNVGDYYLMCERDHPADRGEVVSVYEVVRLTETGNESKHTMLRIE